LRQVLERAARESVELSEILEVGQGTGTPRLSDGLEVAGRERRFEGKAGHATAEEGAQECVAVAGRVERHEIGLAGGGEELEGHILQNVPAGVHVRDVVEGDAQDLVGCRRRGGTWLWSAV
jgi:hypothetical protein